VEELAAAMLRITESSDSRKATIQFYRRNRPTVAALPASTRAKTFRFRSPKVAKIVGLFVGLFQSRARI